MGGAGGLAAAVAAAVAAGGLAAPAAAGVPLLPFFKFMLFLAIFKINIILYMYICLKETVGTKGICLTPRDLRYYPQRVTVCAGTGYSRNGI
jgi:hypothetical protein